MKMSRISPKARRSTKRTLKAELKSLQKVRKAFCYDEQLEAVRLRMQEEITLKKIAEIFGTSHSIIER